MPSPATPRGTNRDTASRRWLVVGAVAGVVLLAGALILWRATRPPKTPDLERMVSASAGQLLVDASPWAEMVGVTDGNGQELALPEDPYTPLILSLPPGRYSIELAHPDLGAGTRRCEVELSETEPATCRLSMTDVDGAQYLKEAGW